MEEEDVKVRLIRGCNEHFEVSYEYLDLSRGEYNPHHSQKGEGHHASTRDLILELAQTEVPFAVPLNAPCEASSSLAGRCA